MIGLPPVLHDVAYWWLVIEGLVIAVMLWRYSKSVALVDADNQQQWDEIVGIVQWLHAYVEEQYGPADADAEEHPAVEPDEDEPDEPDEPDTVVSHRADLVARMWALLHRREEQPEGRHRTEGGGRTVEELLAEAGLEPLRP